MLLSAARKELERTKEELERTKEERDAYESRNCALEVMHEDACRDVLMRADWIKELNSTVRKMQREMDEMKKQLPENEDGEAQSAEQPNEQSPLLATADETTEYTAYQNLQRVHWLTVHCGPHITLSSLQKAGIRADGCHAAACERGGVITYIHLSERCRQPALANFLQHMPGCTSARVVNTVNDKTLVCTQEFLDLVRLLGHGCVTSDGDKQGLLSRYMKKTTTAKPSKLADQNAMQLQHIVALERDNVKLRQQNAAMERDLGGRILEQRQQISALNIDLFKERQEKAALEERLGAGESGGV